MTTAAAADDPATAALDDAVTAALVFAVTPALVGGLRLRGAHGPLRDAVVRLIQALQAPETSWRRLPLEIDDASLLGGLDLTATLAAGRPVMRVGLLSNVAGGVLVLPSAERIAPETAGRLAQGPEPGQTGAIGLLALDESEADDPPLAPALAERLMLDIDLSRCAYRPTVLDAGIARTPDVKRARQRWQMVDIDDATLAMLATAATMLGVPSARALQGALVVCRILAALEAVPTVTEAHALQAIRLTLIPRATRLPAPADPESAAEPPPAEEPPPPSEAETAANQEVQALADQVIAAAQALLPPDVLAALAANRNPIRSRTRGRIGDATRSVRRGRPAGHRPGLPGHGARLDLLATLRAAVPWQRLRPAPTGTARIAVRRADLRVKSFLQPTATTTVFAVDASGSAALHRLAEAKGAVELMLADCYVRRDHVALVAFRGTAATPLLPPTRALVRAKRSLDALPGGGGTPIAAGLDLAQAIGREEQRRGRRVRIVVLTDGRANIDRTGKPGRAQAEADALVSARALAATGWPVVVIDASARPDPAAARLADAAGARYLPLPYADAGLIARAVRSET